MSDLGQIKIKERAFIPTDAQQISYESRSQAQNSTYPSRVSFFAYRRQG